MFTILGVYEPLTSIIMVAFALTLDDYVRKWSHTLHKEFANDLACIKGNFLKIFDCHGDKWCSVNQFFSLKQEVEMVRDDIL